ncbi:CDP-glycerol glycerophosphotransferase family protein [Nonomuraea sp. NPDC055795]
MAGPAGRDRYRRARVGVRDENVHEVGRPQLEGISAEGPGLPYRTVLYAPTWEGWTDDLHHTSLTTMGPRIVRALLDHEPELRVVYKPHPLTGHRDKAAARAHAEIVAMLDAAALARSKARHPSGGATRAPVKHLVVTKPDLYACFNQADLMITDISSVVADFLASGKPYAVTNVSGMAEKAFHETTAVARSPPTRGGRRSAARTTRSPRRCPRHASCRSPVPGTRSWSARTAVPPSAWSTPAPTPTAAHRAAASARRPTRAR